DDGWIATEASLPIAVAQHRNEGRSTLVVGRLQHAAERGSGSEIDEIVTGHELRARVLVILFDLTRLRRQALSEDVRKDGRVLTIETERVHRHRPALRLGRLADDAHERVGITEWQVRRERRFHDVEEREI